MKRTFLFVGVVLILALASAVGCSDNVSPEEDVVRDFYDAVEDGNPEIMASLTTEDYARVVLDLENYEEQTEGVSIKYSNISTELLYQFENDAEVNISYDYQYERNGEMDNIGNTTDIVNLIKVDDSWLIDSRKDIYDDEWWQLQSIITRYMKSNGITVTTPQTTWTKDLEKHLFSEEDVPNRDLIPSGDLLNAYYQWDSEGNLYQCRDTSCPDPF